MVACFASISGQRLQTHACAFVLRAKPDRDPERSRNICEMDGEHATFAITLDSVGAAATERPIDAARRPARSAARADGLQILVGDLALAVSEHLKSAKRALQALAA